MKRGRKAKPVALKIVTGNPGKRKLSENQPESSAPAAVPQFMLEPEHTKAVAIWNRECDWLEVNGLLTAQTEGAFAAYCILRAEFERDPGKMPTSRIAEMRKQAELFHLIPGAIKPPEKGDAEDEFFQKKRA